MVVVVTNIQIIFISWFQGCANCRWRKEFPKNINSNTFIIYLFSPSETTNIRWNKLYYENARGNKIDFKYRWGGNLIINNADDHSNNNVDRNMVWKFTICLERRKTRFPTFPHFYHKHYKNSINSVTQISGVPGTINISEKMQNNCFRRITLR